MKKFLGALFLALYSLTLGAIFDSPLFGFVEPIESDSSEAKIPKNSPTAGSFLTSF